VSPQLVGATDTWRPSARRRFWRRLVAMRWFLTALLWVVLLALGYWGFARYYISVGAAHTVSGTLYAAWQLFVLQSGYFLDPIPWQLEVARFLAPLVAALTAVEALAVLLRDQLVRLRLRLLRDHVVVCGLGRSGMLLAAQLHAEGRDVVVVERSDEGSHIESCRDLAIPVVLGDAAEVQTLRRARIGAARAVIAVCGEDGMNAQIAVSAAAAARRGGRRGRPLTCTVHIVDVQLWRLLRDLELGAGPNDPLRLEFFNVFEGGARALLHEYPPMAPPSAPRSRVLIVGLGRLGESIALRAAYLWRTEGDPSGGRPEIMVVDRAAQQRCEGLLARQPHLGQVCDLVPVEIDVTSPAFEHGDLPLEDGRGPLALACVCLDDDARGLSAALVLHRHLRDRGIPLVVRMTRELGLATLVTGDAVTPAAAAGEFADVHAFSLLEETCTPDLVLRGTRERLARALHDAYLRDHTVVGRPAEDAPWALPWTRLPHEIRESNRAEADHVRIGLAAAGYEVGPLEDWAAAPMEFTEDEAETMARLEHERWLAERRAAGWIYGSGPTDRTHKTNPRLVEWEKLAENDRETARTTTRSLPGLLGGVGLQVRWRGGGGGAGGAPASPPPTEGG
jgi:hypothetical protein